MLDPDSQLKAGQASIDIRLGFDFCLVTPSAIGIVDEFTEHPPGGISFEQMYAHEYVPIGKKLIIHPHQFMLAQTLEYMKFPADLMGYVVGRSTWGRLGLIVATAVGIHPHFAGCLTLELRNLGETPLALYPGQTIAQLFVHQVVDGNGKPGSKEAPKTQYVGAVDMVPRKISSGRTHSKLKKLTASK